MTSRGATVTTCGTSRWGVSVLVLLTARSARKPALGPIRPIVPAAAVGGIGRPGAGAAPSTTTSSRAMLSWAPAGCAARPNAIAPARAAPG